MKLLTKLGGLVAVAAVILAGASLLVSPTPVHAAAGDFCSNAGQTSFLAADANTGPALTQVASGSTTKARIYIDAAAADELIVLTASAGSITGAVLASTVGADNNACSTAGLDNVLMGAGADDAAGAADRYATVTFIAPTVTTDTLVTITIDHDQDAVVEGVMALTVKAAVTPDSLTASAPTNGGAIPASPGAASADDQSDITFTLKEGTTALAGESITVITTLGLLESQPLGTCIGDDANGDTNAVQNGVQACTATTNGSGQITISLFGAGGTGTATVTAIKGSLSVSKDITLFGSASSASAAAKASTMQAVASGSNTITVTVLDSSGNAVPNIAIANGAVAVSGPTTLLTFDGATNTAAANDCGFGGEGTDSKGQCVIQVSSTATTSLGDHLFKVTVAGVTAKAEVTIKVVGVAASVSNDAPASVAANSQTEIIATGADSNGDAVGAGVATTATIIEGNGGLLNVDSTTGSAGEQKFTFVAPSQSGTTTILVTIGSASQLITVSIGAAAPTPGAGFADALSDGVNLTTYGGGTVAQLGTDAADAGATSVSVTVEGAWVIYVVGAPSFVNQAFNDQFPDGVPAGQVVLVLK